MDTAKSYLLIASVFPSTWGADLSGEREDSGRECWMFEKGGESLK